MYRPGLRRSIPARFRPTTREPALSVTERRAAHGGGWSHASIGPIDEVAHGAAALALALLGSLVPLASVYAHITERERRNRRVGDLRGRLRDVQLDDADRPDDHGELHGLIGAAGDTVILELPTGFKFNTAVGNISITGAGCDLTTTAGLVMANQTASIKILHASTVDTCVLTYVGLQVQPTSGTLHASAPITQIGSSPTAIAGQLRCPRGGRRQGRAARLHHAAERLDERRRPIRHAASRDRSGSVHARRPNAPVVLSITPGTGTAVLP